MKNREGIKSAILQRFFGKMIRAGAVCIILLMLGLFLGKNIFGSYVWYGTEGAYPLLHWISENQGMFVFALFLTGLLAIGIFYWIKLLNYFQEVMEAMEKLSGEEKLIELRPDLREVEQYMNKVQMEIHRNQRLAKEAEQRKNDLVVYLAHDLKTPLTSVIGYLTLLKEERHISPELQEKYLSISLEKAQRLEDLINEFFEITRFNLTHLELEKSTVPLKMMLEQIVFEFQPMLTEKNLMCSLEVEPENLQLTCDTDKMQRVFDNLLRNAVLYSYENSTIQIKAQLKEKEAVPEAARFSGNMQNLGTGAAAQNENRMDIAGGSQVHIQVENSGATIPREKLARIFEQFYRLDSARQSKTGGAGLGLAIAKEIVELHGGRISAESQAEVTRFLVELPVK